MSKKKKRFLLLLLGTADSGKSTFSKQMTIIHTDSGFTREELIGIIPILRDNVLCSIKILITACQIWIIPFSDELQESKVEVEAATILNETIARHVTVLWNSIPIQSAYERRESLQLPGGASSCQYLFENVERFSRNDFVPNIEDMLRVKIKTTGVKETEFTVNKSDFVMIDVGGQRREREKWLPFFHDATAIIWLVALNEFDMFLEEDEEQKINRLEESLTLFSRVSRDKFLKEVPFIVFLNKADLFTEKIKTQPLSNYYSDYDDFVKKLSRPDLSDFDAGCEYMADRFDKVFKGCRLYTFVTCALNTDNCRKVFSAVNDAIIARMFADNF